MQAGNLALVIEKLLGLEKKARLVRAVLFSVPIPYTILIFPDRARAIVAGGGCDSSWQGGSSNCEVLLGGP